MNLRYLLSALLLAAALPMASAAQDGMSSMPGMSHAATPGEAQGTGVVKAVDTAKNTVTLQHEAIAALHWPAMTMPFKVADAGLLKSVHAGDKVSFTLKPTSAGPVVTAIVPAH